jgi:hypothetical protein
MAAPSKTMTAVPSKSKIEVYRRTPVASVDTVRAALDHVASWWKDGAEFWSGSQDDDVVEQFEFVDNDYRFTVLIEPVEHSRKV